MRVFSPVRLVVCSWLSAATAFTAEDHAAGVLLRLYQIDQPTRGIPELVAGQAPNEIRVIPTLELLAERGDFGQVASPFYTEIDGFLAIDAAGEYGFRLISDDGSRLWIDDTRVIDHDGLHAPEPKDGAARLGAGARRVRIRHFDAGGGVHLELLWKPPGATDFAPIPPAALTHDAAAPRETAPGPKRVLPPLRKGLPGDGSPLAEPHPLYTVVDKQAAPPDLPPLKTRWARNGVFEPGQWLNLPQEDARKRRRRRETTPEPTLWLAPIDEPYAFTNALNYERDILVANGASGDLRRLSYQKVGDVAQGCVFRFSGGHSQGFNSLVRGPRGTLVLGYHPDGPAALLRTETQPADPVAEANLTRLETLSRGAGRSFEMKEVIVTSYGLEIQFTKPLDERVGWDPESYYLEQWPFDFDAGAGPTRDGTALPVESVGISRYRKRVYLKVPGIKPSNVVYLRLLPPCLSEYGDLPRTTEAWVTVLAIPETSLMDDIGAPPASGAQNTLTDEERAAGWRLLFDGQTLAGWRGFRKDSPSAGWQVRNGCITLAKAGAGDLVTDQAYDNFELALEWRISAGGNSGIFFHVAEDEDYVWRTGPEVQVLDNREHPDSRSALTSAASNYALHAPSKDAAAPVGLFNQSRLVVNGPHVEHWLNGEKVVEYELWSDDWEKRVANSKFKAMPRYGREKSGHIAIQDHGDPVWYRNIKIRPLE